MSIFSQNLLPNNGFQYRLNPRVSNEKNDVLNDSVEWFEQINERTEFSALYKSNDGQVKALYSREAIHYRDRDGAWQRISPNVKFRSENLWCADEQANPTYFERSGGAALTLDRKQQLWIGKKTRINNVIQNPVFEVNGNLATAALDNGILKTIEFAENRFKYSYHLSEPTIAFSEMLYFDEQVTLPDGYTIKILSGENSLYRSSRIGVFNEMGELSAQLREPFCFDASNNWIIANYEIIHGDDADYIRVSVPTDWINSEQRTYPITIDPIVAGPTSSWSGGAMPSCIIPSYNKDSIQVTIPGGVTVTGIFVTGSFYADPFTNATMGEGEMKFSTSCGMSQAFVVSGASIPIPGTAYLDSFNILNPLMCCFPESCSPTSFYLTMNLGRTGPGMGCNTTYIRYDPLTTSWPFQAVVVGKTPETYGSKWYVPNTPICSNTCTLTGLAYANYGVAPFTYTHPWSTEVVTQGDNIGCSSGADNYQFTLTIPDCPKYCDTSSVLVVPPPIITDACGNVVSGIPAETVPLKMAPAVSALYDTLVCSGQPFSIQLQSCAAGGTIYWQGNNAQDTAVISDVPYNNGSSLSTLNYTANTTFNGCNSDTLEITLYVSPPVNLDYTWSPNPIVVATPTTFTSTTNPSAGEIVEWNWVNDQQLISTSQNTELTFSLTGDYSLCLGVEALNGCPDTICKVISVIPASIVAPNIITPNGDLVNDLLIFKYLEFYPQNHLVILNRWGNIVYEADNYKNNWNGGNLTEGAYFYKLTYSAYDNELSGFFQIER